MDAWLRKMYDRHGVGYVVGTIVLLIVLTITVSAPVVSFFPARYLDLSLGEYLLTLAVVAVLTPLTATVTLFRFRREIKPILDWSSGDRSEALVATAGTWAFETPRRVLVFAAVLGTPLVVPAVVVCLTVPASYTGALGILEMVIGALGATAVAFFGAHVLLELFLKPARESIPIYELPHSRAPGVGPTLLVVPLALTLIAAVALSYLHADRAESGEGALLPYYAGAVGVSAFAGLVMVPLLSGSVLSPIRNLIEGNRAVGRGELAPMPITTTDEFGELTASFNQMVDALHEREALRGQNTELVDELRASRTRIAAAADEARRRVERDLHDGAQQNLVMLNLKLGLLRRALETDPEAAPAMVDEAHAELERALAELRDLAHGIYPAVLTSDGLPGALAEVVESAPIEVTLDCDGAGRYPPRLEAAVYFCCLEALQNAGKHAGGGVTVTVRLAESNGELRFEVSDDGPGFDVASVNGSAGIQNMVDRIGALGGELRVESHPGAGTRVIGSVAVEG